MVRTDLDAVHLINQENVPAVGTETRATLEEIFELCSTALVAEDDAIRGFCMVLPPGTSYGSPNYLYFCDNYDDFVYLDRVAVTASHQGRGIGPLLYREVEARATAEWFTLEVNVKPLNEGSLRFHAREGFVEVDQMETRPGKIVSLMVKRLR
jgi:predicted GNAT superfamily acetyltransferase